MQDLKIVVTAILIQRESGGNLAEVFDKAAYVIRERFRLKRQVRVHTAQGRLTGWILSFLPIVLGIADRLHSAAIHLLRRVRQQDTATGEGPARLSALSVLVFGGPMTK